MSGLVESLTGGFDRILRWLYPAGLLVVLMYASDAPCLNFVNQISGMQWPWGLVIFAIVGGFIVYLLQAYLINQFISFLFDIPGLLSIQTKHLKGFTKWLVERAERWGEPAWRRWGTGSEEKTNPKVREQARERLNGWLDYSWGTYHAGFITVWLTLVFFCNSDANSFLSNVSPCLVWGLAIPLIASLLWQYLILTRVTLLIAKDC